MKTKFHLTLLFDVLIRLSMFCGIQFLLVMIESFNSFSSFEASIEAASFSSFTIISVFPVTKSVAFLRAFSAFSK